MSEESAKIGTTLKDLKVIENVHGYDGHAKFTPSNRKVHTMPRLEIVKVSPHQLPGKNIAIPVTKAMWDSNAKGLNLSKVIHYYIFVFTWLSRKVRYVSRYVGHFERHG